METEQKEKGVCFELPLIIATDIAEYTQTSDLCNLARSSHDCRLAVECALRRRMRVKSMTQLKIAILDDHSWDDIKDHFNGHSPDQPTAVLSPGVCFLLGSSLYPRSSGFTGNVTLIPLDQSYWPKNNLDGMPPMIQWCNRRSGDGINYVTNLITMEEKWFRGSWDISIVDDRTVLEYNRNGFWVYRLDTSDEELREPFSSVIDYVDRTTGLSGVSPLPCDRAGHVRNVVRNEQRYCAMNRHTGQLEYEFKSRPLLSSNLKLAVHWTDEHVYLTDTMTWEDEWIIRLPCEIAKAKIGPDHKHIALQFKHDHSWWMLNVELCQWSLIERSKEWDLEESGMAWINHELFRLFVGDYCLVSQLRWVGCPSQVISDGKRNLYFRDPLLRQPLPSSDIPLDRHSVVSPNLFAHDERLYTLEWEKQEPNDADNATDFALE